MITATPRLSVETGRRRSEAVVLVLHGGRELSTDPVRAHQVAVLRMVPFARRIARRGAGRVAVARLRYASRGWNAATGSPAPVNDAEWALRQLTERFAGLPISVVGHSMGGRTALRIGGHPQVRGVVALAPWLPAHEPVSQLAGRRVLLMHGSADRMTSPAGTEVYAGRIEAAGAAVSLVTVYGEGHAMLRRAQVWHELSAQFALSTVLEDFQPSGWQGSPQLVRQVVQGAVRLSC
ncbi:MAG TPA: alpha/beta hydrolase [Jatrophihabitans sp.]|jgi:dienelactone hydrolase|uniref:dienelactone hydrolase family protein n=1 Tax=Jatrophihabitans sp. TaxID=1932789 RepID=UPI002F1A10C5